MARSMCGEFELHTDHLLSRCVPIHEILGTNGKYPLSVYEFVHNLVHHDHTTRPSMHNVAARFGELHSRR